MELLTVINSDVDIKEWFLKSQSNFMTERPSLSRTVPQATSYLM